MARLTVEDCLTQVDNRFELVLKAAKRARALEKGADAKVPWDHDKPSVVALREIAGGFIEEPQENTTSIQADVPVEEEQIQVLEVEDEPFETDLEEAGFSELSEAEEEPEILEEDIAEEDIAEEDMAEEDMAEENLAEEEPESEENL